MSDDPIASRSKPPSWHRALPEAETWIAGLARRTLEAACPGIGPAGESASS